MQSLVPSLSVNNLIPLTIIFSSVLQSFNKTIPLRVDNKQYPSGLARIGPFRIGKIENPPVWDPSELANIRPLRFGTPPFCENKTPPDWDPSEFEKIWTPPDWEPSGFIKVAFRRFP